MCNVVFNEKLLRQQAAMFVPVRGVAMIAIICSLALPHRGKLLLNTVQPRLLGLQTGHRHACAAQCTCWDTVNDDGRNTAPARNVSLSWRPGGGGFCCVEPFEEVATRLVLGLPWADEESPTLVVCILLHHTHGGRPCTVTLRGRHYYGRGVLRQGLCDRALTPPHSHERN